MFIEKKDDRDDSVTQDSLEKWVILFEVYQFGLINWQQAARFPEFLLLFGLVEILLIE